MAKIKPINAGKPISGLGSKLTAVGAACDVVGMTDVPILSQGAELVSAGIDVCSGDYIGATLSIGSMIPGVGKAAEAAKIAHKAKKVADVSSASKNGSKLLSITARKADELIDGSKQIKNATKSSPRNVAPKPSKTQAKPAKKQPIKETQIAGSKPDIVKDSAQTNNKQFINSIFTQPTPKVQKKNLDWYNCHTKSNPALNNKFKATGSPLGGNVRSASSLFGI